MTSVKTRMENVKTEIEIIKEAFQRAGEHCPPCCLRLSSDGKFSCDVKQSLPKDKFNDECRKCREEVREFLKVHNF